MLGSYFNSLNSGTSGVSSGRVLPPQLLFSHCSSMEQSDDSLHLVVLW